MSSFILHNEDLIAANKHFRAVTFLCAPRATQARSYKLPEFFLNSGFFPEFYKFLQVPCIESLYACTFCFCPYIVTGRMTDSRSLVGSKVMFSKFIVITVLWYLYILTSLPIFFHPLGILSNCDRIPAAWEDRVWWGQRSCSQWPGATLVWRVHRTEQHLPVLQWWPPWH